MGGPSMRRHPLRMALYALLVLCVLLRCVPTAAAAACAPDAATLGVEVTVDACGVARYAPGGVADGVARELSGAVDPENAASPHAFAFTCEEAAPRATASPAPAMNLSLTTGSVAVAPPSGKNASAHPPPSTTLTCTARLVPMPLPAAANTTLTGDFIVMPVEARPERPLRACDGGADVFAVTTYAVYAAACVGGALSGVPVAGASRLAIVALVATTRNAGYRELYEALEVGGEGGAVGHPHRQLCGVRGAVINILRPAWHSYEILGALLLLSILVRRYYAPRCEGGAAPHGDGGGGGARASPEASRGLAVWCCAVGMALVQPLALFTAAVRAFGGGSTVGGHAVGDGVAGLLFAVAAAACLGFEVVDLVPDVITTTRVADDGDHFSAGELLLSGDCEWVAAPPPRILERRRSDEAHAHGHPHTRTSNAGGKHIVPQALRRISSGSSDVASNNRSVWLLDGERQQQQQDAAPKPAHDVCSDGSGAGSDQTGLAEDLRRRRVSDERQACYASGVATLAPPASILASAGARTPAMYFVLPYTSTACHEGLGLEFVVLCCVVLAPAAADVFGCLVACGGVTVAFRRPHVAVKDTISTAVINACCGVALVCGRHEMLDAVAVALLVAAVALVMNVICDGVGFQWRVRTCRYAHAQRALWCGDIAACGRELRSPVWALRREKQRAKEQQVRQAANGAGCGEGSGAAMHIANVPSALSDGASPPKSPVTTLGLGSGPPSPPAGLSLTVSRDGVTQRGFDGRKVSSSSNRTSSFTKPPTRGSGRKGEHAGNGNNPAVVVSANANMHRRETGGVGGGSVSALSHSQGLTTPRDPAGGGAFTAGALRAKQESPPKPFDIQESTFVGGGGVGAAGGPTRRRADTTAVGDISPTAAGGSHGARSPLLNMSMANGFGLLSPTGGSGAPNGGLPSPASSRRVSAPTVGATAAAFFHHGHHNKSMHAGGGGGGGGPGPVNGSISGAATGGPFVRSPMSPTEERRSVFSPQRRSPRGRVGVGMLDLLPRGANAAGGGGGGLDTTTTPLVNPAAPGGTNPILLRMRHPDMIEDSPGATGMLSSPEEELQTRFPESLLSDGSIATAGGDTAGVGVPRYSRRVCNGIANGGNGNSTAPSARGVRGPAAMALSSPPTGMLDTVAALRKSPPDGHHILTPATHPLLPATALLEAVDRTPPTTAAGDPMVAAAPPRRSLPRALRLDSGNRSPDLLDTSTSNRPHHRRRLATGSPDKSPDAASPQAMPLNDA